LQGFGISWETTRERVEQLLGRGAQTPSGHLPCTPRARRVLDHAADTALLAGNQDVGPADLFLTLLDETSGVALQVLEAQGVDRQAVRARVIDLIATAEEATPAQPRTNELGRRSLLESLQ